MHGDDGKEARDPERDERTVASHLGWSHRIQGFRLARDAR